MNSNVRMQNSEVKGDFFDLGPNDKKLAQQRFVINQE